MIKLTFSKNLRLLTSDDFNFVFEKPIRISTKQMILLGRFNGLKYPRIGITIAKKNLKCSHDRNRIKRLVRESFRLNQYVIMKMDFVFLAKKDIINFDNHMLLLALEKLWHRCHYHLLQNY